MGKYFPLFLLLSLVKFLIHGLGNHRYGFHRDELLHLSVSEHLDWGFMEFPPLIGLLGKISYWLFDYSLWGLRLFPTLAGVVILILCCLMAREMGGKFKGLLLAGICVLAFLPFYRNHTLFQPVAFDQLFWTLGFYFLLRYINSQEPRFLLFLGISFALGLLNKYTIAIWGLGVLVGLLFYQRGRLFKDKWLYFSGVIAFLIILPNVLWQIQHDFPFWQHLQTLQEKQLDQIDSLAFGRDQLQFPLTLILSLIGLWGFFFDSTLKKYRSIGIAVLTTFATMWFLQSKSYYIFAIYPVLFASGAYMLERLLQKKVWLLYLVAFFLLAFSVPFIPRLSPILPIESYVKYLNKEEVDGRIELTGDYADMFGWEEQVALVDSLYQSLAEEEKNNCVIWAENYGEAGAVKILGKKYSLPNPICLHGSFWLWGYGNEEAKVWISLGNEPPAVESIFEEVELVRWIHHKYAIEEENNIPLYLCRKPKVNIPQLWTDYRAHVFD